MYFPETMTEMGINAPKAHQRVISKLNTALGTLFYVDSKIKLEPLPETMIDEGQTSPVPDIQLFDNEKLVTPVIIEVSHPTGMKNDFNKVKKLIEENDYGILEGFVYDYVNNSWRKYQKGIGEITENASWSQVLELDFARLKGINMLQSTAAGTAPTKAFRAIKRKSTSN